jgi:hypothetical protein
LSSSSCFSPLVDDNIGWRNKHRRRHLPPPPPPRVSPSPPPPSSSSSFRPWSFHELAVNESCVVWRRTAPISFRYESKCQRLYTTRCVSQHSRVTYVRHITLEVVDPIRRRRENAVSRTGQKGFVGRADSHCGGWDVCRSAMGRWSTDTVETHHAPTPSSEVRKREPR